MPPIIAALFVLALTYCFGASPTCAQSKSGSDLELEVRADDQPAQTCLTAQQLRARVAHYSSTSAAPRGLRLVLYVTGADSAELQIVRKGEVVSRRRFEQLPSACADRRDAVALSIALALERAAASERASRPAAGSGTSPTPTKPAQTQPASSAASTANPTPQNQTHSERDREPATRDRDPATRAAEREPATRPAERERDPVTRPAARDREPVTRPAERELEPVTRDRERLTSPANLDPVTRPAARDREPVTRPAERERDTVTREPEPAPVTQTTEPARMTQPSEPEPAPARMTQPPDREPDPPSTFDTLPNTTSQDPRRERTSALQLHLGARITLEAVPMPVWVGALGIELPLSKALSLDISVLASTAGESTLAGARARASFLGLEALGCGSAPLSIFMLQICGGASVGLCTVRGEGYPRERPEATLLWAAGLARVMLRWPQREMFALRLLVQPHLSISRPELQVEGSNARQRSAWLGGSAGLELWFALP